MGGVQMSNETVLAIITTLDEDPLRTIASLKNQTLKVSLIIVVIGSIALYDRLKNRSSEDILFLYLPPDMTEPLGVRLAKAINFALEQVDLNKYDYLLKLDADVVLPARFLEENIKVNADYVGRAGYTMLLKVKPFLKVFNGRFAEVGAEDSYIGLKLLYRGYRIGNYLLRPTLMPAANKKHSYRYYFTLGREFYRLGYEPLHVLEKLRYGYMELFRIFGFFVALLTRSKKYEFAKFVSFVQIMRIIHGKTWAKKAFGY
jgi:hypothetical protein